MLQGGRVIGIDDITDLEKTWEVPLGVSGKKAFRYFESGVRRLQRELHIPYFAAFDLFRFYEASLGCLPRYSLCHEHNGVFYGGAALACRKLGIPYVLTVSADPLLERSLAGRPLRGFHRYVAASEARFTFRTAKRILCVSDPAKTNLVETWGVDPHKIVVMANGVDAELFNPDYSSESARVKLGIGETNPVIGFVGGFQPWHGIDRLVEGFAKIHHDQPASKLLLIGDGRARPMIEQKIAECGVCPDVIITGLVPQERVPELMAAIDVAVLPYPELPQDLWFSPLKLYEYMASGKAIVASRAGQIAQVIVDRTHGILTNPGDVDEMNAAIIELLENPELRERLGKNAREKAVTQHSWDRYIQSLISVYEDALR
jgi:glycosyltransferase involved in cell wall biosynthesis